MGSQSLSSTSDSDSVLESSPKYYGAKIALDVEICLSLKISKSEDIVGPFYVESKACTSSSC